MSFVNCCLNALAEQRQVCASFCRRGDSDCFSQCTDTYFCTVALAADCVGVPLTETQVPQNGCEPLVPATPQVQKPEITIECRQPPAAPQYKIKLAWKPSPGATGYNIEVMHAEIQGAEFELVAANVPVTSYVDTVYSGNWIYRISAMSPAGTSDPADPITVIARETMKRHCLHPSPMESP